MNLMPDERLAEIDAFLEPIFDQITPDQYSELVHDIHHGGRHADWIQIVEENLNEWHITVS